MDGDQILYGLQNIKGIGKGMAEFIINNRPYSSPEEFIRVCSEHTPVIVNAGHCTKLMEAGAFDEYGYRMAVCVECAGNKRRRLDPEVRKLADCPDCDATGWQRIEIPDMYERAKLEDHYLQIALTDIWAEQVALHKEEIDEMATFDEARREIPGEIYQVPGVVATISKQKSKWTKTPEDWAHVTITWQGEELRFAAFPPAFKEYGYLLKPGKFGWFMVETDPKGPRLKEGQEYV
jgi:DNA polymerase III alpha subunit